LKKNSRIIIYIYTYIYNIKYKRHRTATTASHAYTYVYFSGLQAGEETRVSKKREKNIIRHQIKADANLSRSSTAIDRFYTAVTLARRPQSKEPSSYTSTTPHRTAPPLTIGPNRMCLQRAKTALWVHPRCHAQTHLHARVGYLPIYYNNITLNII